jgi:hypothetical protein
MARCGILRDTAGSTWVIGEFAGYVPSGFQSGTKVTAHGAQKVKTRLSWNTLQLDRELRLTITRQIARHADMAVTQRRIAGQTFDGAARVVISETAVGVEIQRSGGGKLGAMNTRSAQAGFYLG